MDHTGWCRGSANYSATGTTFGRDNFTARLTSRSSDFILSPWQETLSHHSIYSVPWTTLDGSLATGLASQPHSLPQRRSLSIILLWGPLYSLTDQPNPTLSCAHGQETFSQNASVVSIWRRSPSLSRLSQPLRSNLAFFDDLYAYRTAEARTQQLARLNVIRGIPFVPKQGNPLST